MKYSVGARERTRTEIINYCDFRTVAAVARLTPHSHRADFNVSVGFPPFVVVLLRYISVLEFKLVQEFLRDSVAKSYIEFHSSAPVDERSDYFFWTPSPIL